MKFNINNFINTSSQSSKIVDFQDLDHIDGVEFLQSALAYINLREMN